MDREVRFYRTESGSCPVEQFLDSLKGKQAQKVVWVLKLIEEMDSIPSRYFKKLVNTEDLWEARIDFGSDTFRLLGFLTIIRLSFLCMVLRKRVKSSRKKPLHWPMNARKTILGEKDMSDLQKYISKRKMHDPEFAEDFEIGYEQFKLGVLLRQAREKAGLTQEELAHRMNTKKSAISRIENHAEDIKLSTLEKFAQAIGKTLRLRVA